MEVFFASSNFSDFISGCQNIINDAIGFFGCDLPTKKAKKRPEVSEICGLKKTFVCLKGLKLISPGRLSG